MTYEYSYKNTAADLWQLAMYDIYSSLTGISNLIFTSALLALLVSQWNEAGDFFRGIMILGCCLFPIIQPLFIYRRARRQASGISWRTNLTFTDQGIQIRAGEETSLLPWQEVKRIMKRPGLLVIFADKRHGFVLPDRVLGSDKAAFYQYMNTKMNN